MERLIITQRAATVVAVVLAVIIIIDIAYAAHKGSRATPVRIHPCALVATRQGEVC
jgi:hypothetical protein